MFLFFYISVAPITPDLIWPPGQTHYISISGDLSPINQSSCAQIDFCTLRVCMIFFAKGHCAMADQPTTSTLSEPGRALLA